MAFERYGKGRGHRAQLNLPHFFAYTMVKTYQEPLLFKGDDSLFVSLVEGEIRLNVKPASCHPCQRPFRRADQFAPWHRAG